VLAIMSAPGFHAGTLLTPNDDGRGLSRTFWDSEKNARSMADRLGGGAGPSIPASIAT
jgi:hypothetical protein